MSRSLVDRSNKRLVEVTPFPKQSRSYILFCRDCGNMCSATPGDYWQHPDGATVRCSDCLEPMWLVIRVSITSHDGMLWGDGNQVIRQEVTFQELREIVPDIGR